MNIRPRSLRARLVWATAIMSTIAMVVVTATMVALVIDLTNGRVKASADYRFDTGTATVSQDEFGKISLLKTPSDVIEDRVWVFDAAGKRVAGPEAGSRVHAVVLSLSDTAKRTAVHHGDYRYVAGPVKNKRTGKTFAVVVAAASTEPFENRHTRIFIGLGVLALIVVVGTSTLAAWIVGRTLKPVSAMAESAQDWSEHDLDTRFDLGSADDEIANLGSTLNILLDRVATAIRGEQLLTSELAHELRTPLTAIRGEAELGLMQSPDPATQARLERVVALSDRLTASISTLVTLARQRPAGGQRANVATAVINVLGGTRVRDDIRVDLADLDDSINVAAPIEMLERMLAPLVDNALRFATTQLTVSTSSANRTVSLSISDDGPGVDPDAEVFGAGLGLALSQRVARTLGGETRLTSEAQPTTFTVELPMH